MVKETNLYIFSFRAMKRERIIYTLLLLTVYIVFIQLVRDEPDMVEYKNTKYWINKTFSEKTYPLVFGGDSRVYRGISPAEFEDEFPEMKGVNLGYSSNGYHPEYMKFMDRRLDKSAESPVIALGISPYNFSQRGSRSAHYRLQRDKRKKEEIIQYMYFYNFTRFFQPLDILKTFGLEQKKDGFWNFRLKYHFDGWMESYYLQPDSTRLLSSYKATFTNNDYNEESVGMLLRQVQRWTDEGITVVAFRTPATLGIRVLEDSLSGFLTDSFIVQFQTAGGNWIEVDNAKYETYDGSHLDHLSALQFSRDLAVDVREILESSE